MNREEMLRKLKNLEFRFIWPGNWEDVGFTERPIWLNKKGYGYIACDEPCTNWELPSFSSKKWSEIQKKLNNGDLSIEDLEGTSLEDADWVWESISESNDLCELLAGLKKLPDKLDESFYCVSTYDGYDFFSSYDEFKEAVERDNCDYEWDSLTDDVLAEWIKRMNDGDLDGDLFP